MTMNPIDSLRAGLASLVTIGFVLAAAAAATAGDRRGEWGYSGVYGPLWPGKVIYGEPDQLPPDWRAYPLDFSDSVFVIYPVNRRVRTNFGARRPSPHRRRHRHGG